MKSSSHGLPILAGVLLLAGAIALVRQPLFAGAFIFAGESNGVDVVAHPSGYDGTGGVLIANVCFVDNAASAPFESVAAISVDNTVNTWNGMSAVSPNLLSGASNNIPSGAVDFESVLLHEVGHCIGLAHVNAASESGLTEPDRNFTKATNGADNAFNINSGEDGIIGSNDDLRGDDVNLHWFRMADNNPFLLSPTVDGSNYSRDLADLPDGHLFAENADRTVGALLRNAPNTEAVMQQLSFGDEDQRQLMADGVSTRRFANAGIDRVAETGDDYQLQLVNLGVRAENDPECDITIEFSDMSGLAFCQVAGGNFLDANNIAITTAQSVFSTSTNWFFNDLSNAPGTLSVTKSASPNSIDSGGQLSFSMTVEAIDVDQTGVTLTDAIPPGTTLINDSISCGGSESAGTVSFPIGNLSAGQTTTCGFSVVVNLAGRNVLFFDDMESGSTNWQTTQTSGGINWELGTTHPRSGDNAWFGDNASNVTDFALQFASAVTVQADSELSFWHDFNFEDDVNGNYDGGVLEISTDDGSNWTDLGPNITQGGYNAIIANGFSNPLSGRSAWGGDLGGYQRVVVDLSSFAGQDVLIRWRIGTDSLIADEGWYLDDVAIDLISVDNTACVVSNELAIPSCGTSTSTVLPVDGDSDNDGLPDDYEIANGLDPNDDGSIYINNGPNGDPDGDGLNNLEEFNAGTLAQNRDSDGDGLGDRIDFAPLSNDTNSCVQDGLGDAEFDVTSASATVTQCAADNSIVVRALAIFEIGSITQFFSPNITMDPEVRIPPGAQVEIHAGDPTPGTLPPP